jgi:hypothetical protein
MFYTGNFLKIIIQIALIFCMTILVYYSQLVSRSEIKIQDLVVQVLKLVIEGVRENFNKISQGNNNNITFLQY